MADQAQSQAAIASEAQSFLKAYEREHATTMKVLRAFPPGQTDLRPHPKCKSARELAWVFVLERGLGTMLMNDAFANAPPSGEPPPVPERWHDILDALEQAHRQFADLMARYSDEQMQQQVTFFTGPQTLGKYTRAEAAWYLLHDQIHHRGQLSVYLRMADGRVPSIYGPSADEPWM
jgi:uncharacterized damage-inducible protein DinB